MQPLLPQLGSLPLRNLQGDIAQGRGEARGPTSQGLPRLVIWFLGPEGERGVDRACVCLSSLPEPKQTEDAGRRQSKKGRCMKIRGQVDKGNPQTEGPTAPLRRKRRSSQTRAFVDVGQRQVGGCGGREAQAEGTG